MQAAVTQESLSIDMIQVDSRFHFFFPKENVLFYYWLFTSHNSQSPKLANCSASLVPQIGILRKCRKTQYLY